MFISAGERSPALTERSWNLLRENLSKKPIINQYPKPPQICQDMKTYRLKTAECVKNNSAGKEQSLRVFL